MQRKQIQPAAVLAAIQTLVKLGENHGIEAVHHCYAESIGTIMAEDARVTWRDRIVEAQKDAFALIGN